MIEALTNVVKHAHADRAGVRTSVADGALRVEVSDDGVGGADPGGHGLVGTADRVAALGGRSRSTVRLPAARASPRRSRSRSRRSRATGDRMIARAA